MPIKNQLQVDQSIHINIPVLHSYCELNWMAVWQFHNINLGTALSSTRAQPQMSLQFTAKATKGPEIPFMFVRCYQAKSPTPAKGTGTSENCSGRMSPSRCWPAGSSCCSSLAHCCQITVASLTLWEVCYPWGAEQARWKSCRRR